MSAKRLRDFISKRYDNYDYPYGMGYSYYDKKSYKKKKKIPYADKSSILSRKIEEIPEERLRKNVEHQISKTLDNNTILVEPDVWTKMHHLMAMGGNTEIFAKLLTKEEGGYIIVYDIVIPYQTVGMSRFRMYEEQAGKFMYELNFEDQNPENEMLDVEEVNNITSNIHGHFHSHNSMGSSSDPSPSTRDTQDVEEHREGQPYWIEIIGTFGGFSGRIALEHPKIIVKSDVKMKWWTGIDETLDNVTRGSMTVEDEEYSGKLIRDKGKRYKKNKKKTKKKTTKKKKEKDEDDEGEESDEDEDFQDYEKPFQTKYSDDLPYTKDDIEKVSDSLIIVKWKEEDPLQLTEEKVPMDVQKEIGEILKSVVEPDEMVIIELWEQGGVGISIYREDVGYYDSIERQLEYRDWSGYQEVTELLSTYDVIFWNLHKDETTIDYEVAEEILEGE